MKVTFFGHRDTPPSVRPKLREALISLVEEQGASTFYVGTQGAFDRMVAGTLHELRPLYPQINMVTVLAYLPTAGDSKENTVFPDGIEFVPRKYAIDKRNRRMISRSDFVVTYVCGSTGGAAKYKALAEKQGKHVINLAE